MYSSNTVKCIPKDSEAHAGTPARFSSIGVTSLPLHLRARELTGLQCTGNGVQNGRAELRQYMSALGQSQHHNIPSQAT